MIIPKHARYDYVNKKACEFLEEFNIKSFPFDIFNIIKLNNWGICLYSELMEEYSCDRETVIRCLGSKDGFTQIDADNYTIAYNDDKFLGNRIRFTLMHEIGHIYLKHLEDFESTTLFRGCMSKEENIVLENEANAFARNVLVPTSILTQLKNKSYNSISRQFEITIPAARTRLTFYNTDRAINEKVGISKNLYNVFFKFYYKKACSVCGFTSISKVANYCSICGNHLLKWGEGTMIYEEKVKLDDNSKAIRCPMCDNEHILDDGEYCHICGTYLINKCDNRHWNEGSYYDGDEPCGHLLPANARYCHICGNASTFLNDHILYEWDGKEKSPQEMIIPDGIDEELPFN